MEKYLKGEKQHRTTKVDVENKVATISHVTLLDNGEQWYMDTIIDMSEETPEDVLANAAMNYLIQVIRPKGLKVKKASVIDEKKVHKPSDYPSGRGTGVQSPAKAILNFLVYVAGMDRTEAEEIVKNDLERAQLIITQQLIRSELKEKKPTK